MKYAIFIALILLLLVGCTLPPEPSAPGAAGQYFRAINDWATDSTTFFLDGDDTLECAPGEIVTLKYVVESDDYVYKTFYMWNESSGEWDLNTFNEAVIGTSNWIADRATWEVPFSCEELLNQTDENNELFAVAYSCSVQSDNSFDCHNNKWQLEIVSVNEASIEDYYCSEKTLEDVKFQDIAIFDKFYEVGDMETSSDIGVSYGLPAAEETASQVVSLGENVYGIIYQKYTNEETALELFNISNTQHTRTVLDVGYFDFDYLFCHTSEEYYDLNNEYYYICGIVHEGFYIQVQHTTPYENEYGARNILQRVRDHIINGCENHVLCQDNSGGDFIAGNVTGIDSYNELGSRYIIGETRNGYSYQSVNNVNYSTYYDHCSNASNSNQLNIGFCDTTGLMSSFGDHCEFGCFEGACIREPVLPAAPNAPGTFTGNIYTCQDLQNIKNDLTEDYQLMNDVDCSETLSWNEGAGFEPIGGCDEFCVVTPDLAFKGDFEGNGFTISNLYINRGSEKDVGLFGAVFRGTLANVNIVNATVLGNTSVGILAGQSNNAYKYTEVVKNIETSGSVSGNTNVGGVLGYGYDLATTEVTSSASVSGTSRIGGLVGHMAFSTVTNSESTGVVSGTEFVGGAVGSGSGTSYKNIIISNTIGSSSVFGDTSVGGVLGAFTSTGGLYLKVENSYSSSSKPCVGNHAEITCN